MRSANFRRARHWRPTAAHSASRGSALAAATVKGEMDSELIYRKTAEGEISISGRSRLREQRLRAVLILIDGETPVSRLCEQFGDKFRPHEAISQLEQMGLIEPVQPATETTDGGAGDPLPVAGQTGDERTSEAELLVPEIGAWAPPEIAATPSEPEFAQEPESLSTPDPEPVSEPEPDLEPAPEPEAAPAPELTAQTDAQDAADSMDVAASARQEEIDIPAVESVADQWPESPEPTTAPEQRPEVQQGAAQQKPAAPPPWLREIVSRLTALFAKRTGAPPRATEPPTTTLDESRRQRSRRPTAWRNWLGIALLGMIAAIGLTVLALPWNDYRQRLEGQARALTGQPVSIADMRLEWFPYPQVVLRDISVGEQPLARVSSARLTPSVRSLGDLRRLSLDVAVDGLTLERRAVAALCGATHLNAQAASKARLRSVHIQNLVLVLPAGRIGGLQADIGVSPDADRPLVSVMDGDGNLRLELAPDAAGCSFTADGQRWTVPMSPGIVLSGLAARGSVDEGGLRLDRFDARSADGIVGGSGNLRWGQDARLDLRLELGHMSLDKMLTSVGAPAVAHGELDGKLHLTAVSPGLHELAHSLTGSGSIVINRGAIDRFNVVEATRSPGKTAVYGGAFSFDRLRAQVELNPQTTIVRNLSVNAGALQADGEITFLQQSRLKGTLYANISSAAHRLRIPIAVGGSLASPELKAIVKVQPESIATEPRQTDRPADNATAL